MFRQSIFASTLILLTLPPFTARGQTEPVVTTDLLRIRTVSSIDVARDASRAVFSVRSIETVEAAEEGGSPSYAYRSHLFALDLADVRAEPKQLTFGRRNDGAPVLSPNGRWIAFVRAAEETGDAEKDRRSAQIWIMPLDGGEARQVTTMEHGAGSPRWSPDAQELLFTSSIPFDEMDGTPPWPMERPQRSWRDAETTDEDEDSGVTPRPDGTRAEIRAWLAQNAAGSDPSVINRIAFQGERAIRRGARYSQLFLIDPFDEEAAPRQLTTGFYDHGSAQFLPNGRGIVYASKKPTAEHPDRVRQHNIHLLNPEDGSDEVLLAREGWSFGSPKPSADGTMIACSARQLDEPTDRQTQLVILPVSTDGAPEPVWMTDANTFDASVRRFEWLPTRGALAFTSAVRGGFPLLTISPGLIKPATLIDTRDETAVGIHAFDVGGGVIVYSQTSPANPSVLRVRDGRGDRLAWDLNEWVRDKRLATMEEAWLDRPDGTRVQYWFMEPTNRAAGQTYPLVLEIHGGPSSMWGPGEATMWHEFQLLCSWGYAVVFANPRGSGGYGYEFQRANFQDWGEGPAGDVLAAVDHVVLDHEWIDRERLVVTGGSYAGYLTAWIASQDNRFKAAVAQRGVYDLATFFGEGNAWMLVEHEMGGFPFDQRYRQIIARNSPFTFVERIRTPLLIMHASNDLRTGVSQSEMLYRALKEMERPVEYVRYPEAGHDLSRTGNPEHRMDRLNRIIEFFERHIENPRPAPTVPDEDTATDETADD